jgi:hypothetical protein
MVGILVHILWVEVTKTIMQVTLLIL